MGLAMVENDGGDHLRGPFAILGWNSSFEVSRNCAPSVEQSTQISQAPIGMRQFFKPMSGPQVRELEDELGNLKGGILEPGGDCEALSLAEKAENDSSPSRTEAGVDQAEIEPVPGGAPGLVIHLPSESHFHVGLVVD